MQFYTNKKHRIKKKIVLVLVRSVKFLSDATIPFQIKPWEYEGLNEELRREGQCDAQKQYLGARDYSHT